MTLHLGKVKPGSTIYIPFDTFAGSTGASITMSGLAVTDIECYKNGSVTQRASDTGYTLLDTDGIDFDGLTGIHGFSIDLSSNATADFFNAGAMYWVVVSAITVDAQTVSFVAATFTIGYEGAVLDTTIATLSSQTSFTLTAGPAEDDAINGCEVVIHDIASAVQVGRAFVSDYTGSTKTVTLVAGTTFTAAAGDNISVFLSALQPTVQGRSLDVTATGAAGIDWANVENPTTALNLSATNIDVDQVVASVSGAVGSVTGNVGGNVTGSVGSVATGGITAASIATNAIDADALAADAVTEIQSGLATAANLATVAGYLDTEIAAILADTNELQTDWVDGGRLDLILDARASQSSVNTIDDFLDTEIGAIITTLGTPAGASISADLAAIEAQTDDIGVAGAGLTAIPWNAAWDAEVQSEATDALDAYDPPTNTEMEARTIVSANYATAANLATVDTVVDAIQVVTDRLSDTLEDDAGTYRFTANALEQAPGSLTVQAIVDGVWDEAIAGHVDSGSTGEALSAAGGAGDPWITALPGSYTAGQAGHILGTNLNATVSSRASQASLDTVDGIVDSILIDTAEIGTAGAGLTALGDTRLANLDATVSSRATPAQVNTEADTALADVGLTTTVTGRVDAAISTRLASAGYTAPDNASIASILVDTGTDIPATLATLALQSSVDSLEAGVVLSNAGIDAIFDRSNGVETGYTLRQAMRLMASALLGELAGAATTTITIRDMGDTKARITATVDADGNRTAVSYDVS